MNNDKFTNLLISTFVILQLLSVLIVTMSWNRYGARSLLVSGPLVFCMSLLGIMVMAKIKVTKDGKSVNGLNNMVGNMVATTVWTAIGSVLTIVAGLFLANHYASAGNSKMIYIAPFIGVAMFYGALVLQAKVLH